MIRFQNVGMTYPNGTNALQEISFEVLDGEFVFLVGPSGSGKSTIIKLLIGEFLPTAGEIQVNGFAMEDISEDELPMARRTVGTIFQDFRLIGSKTVYENLALAMRVVGSSNLEIARRIPYVMSLVGLKGKEQVFPDELSGGEQQRVSIARALINGPKTLIADEPTGNLDPQKSLEIMKLLERINDLGTTVIVVTHEKAMVDHFHKRVINLRGGQIARDEVGGYEGAVYEQK